MEDIKLLNLEDTVGYLVDRAELASIGATLKGKVATYDSLPEGTIGDVYAVGTEAPYSYYAYTESGWLDIGTWPLAGPKGVPGDRGPQGPIGPVGPKGDKGNQGIAGPAGGGVGVDHITNLNLSTGSATVTYTDNTGATLTKSGRITAAGTNYNIDVNDKIPIIAGDNVNIAANTSNTAIKVSANVPVKSVNGQTGAVTITVPTKTSQLTNNSGYITDSYHDDSKQDTLVSGTNIKTINNESILGPGNITISGGGGTAGVTSLNGKTGAINIVEGSNVTVNTSGNTITISATGGGGGGTGETYEVIDISSITTLTDDQYNTLISSPFNKVKNGDTLYDLYQNTTTELIYAVNYLSTGYRVTINKTTKAISTGYINSLTSISSYVKNNLDYNVNNSIYALSAYQGKVLNDRLTTVENKGGVTKLMKQDGTNEATGTIFVGSGLNLANNILTATGGGSAVYSHFVKLSLPNLYKDNTSWGDPTGDCDVTFTFYSTTARYETYDEFLNYLVNHQNSINNCGGQIYGSVGGGEMFDRVIVMYTSEQDGNQPYLGLLQYSGYGEYNPGYYIKSKAAEDTYSILDSAYEI